MKKSNNASHSAAHRQAPPGNCKEIIMIMFTEQKGRAFKLITPCASIFGAILMIMSQYINQK